ncbi:hypothetical protein C8Q76DRAFT_89543 [Earliella scabrosa]|nr:hypothetical protein C8Q76DRAFT_89543 [Earliella scabrosa]
MACVQIPGFLWANAQYIMLNIQHVSPPLEWRHGLSRSATMGISAIYWQNNLGPVLLPRLTAVEGKDLLQPRDLRATEMGGGTRIGAVTYSSWTRATRGRATCARLNLPCLFPASSHLSPASLLRIFHEPERPRQHGIYPGNQASVRSEDRPNHRGALDSGRGGLTSREVNAARAPLGLRRHLQRGASHGGLARRCSAGEEGTGKRLVGIWRRGTGDLCIARADDGAQDSELSLASPSGSMSGERHGDEPDRPTAARLDVQCDLIRSHGPCQNSR